MNLNDMTESAPEQPGTEQEGQSAKPASQEQQAQFDLLLGRARQVLGENGEQLMQALKTDPVKMSVMFGTRTLRQLATMSEKAGQPVDPAVLMHVGLTLIKDIAGLANEAELVPDEQLEGYIREVTQESLAEYMRMDADDGLLQGQPGAEQVAQPGVPPEAMNVMDRMGGAA